MGATARLFVFASAAFGLMLATSACTRDSLPSLPTGASACSAITTVTSVQILLPPGAPFGKNAYRITDPDALRRLVAFVNDRRDVAPPSADVPPGPTLRATFYDGFRVVAIFGTGPGIFYVQCGTNRGTRSASATELGEFQLLITPPQSPK